MSIRHNDKGAVFSANAVMEFDHDCVKEQVPENKQMDMNQDDAVKNGRLNFLAS